MLVICAFWSDSSTDGHAGVWPIRSIRKASFEDVEALEEQAKAIDWNRAQLEISHLLRHSKNQ